MPWIDDEAQEQSRTGGVPLQSAQPLFPSCLCSAVVPIVDLLDDSTLTPDGVAVCHLANQVTSGRVSTMRRRLKLRFLFGGAQVMHSCLVEDTALFLRHVLEKLTRDKQDEMFALLRRLLRFVPHLPQQSGFTLLNYLIGYIMFYARTPLEGSQSLVANALSLLPLVITRFNEISVVCSSLSSGVGGARRAGAPVQGPQADPAQGAVRRVDPHHG